MTCLIQLPLGKSGASAFWPLGVLGLVVAFACPGCGESRQPSVQITPVNCSLESVVTGEEVGASVELTAVGGQLDITGVHAGCGCVAAWLNGLPVRDLRDRPLPLSEGQAARLEMSVGTRGRSGSSTVSYGVTYSEPQSAHERVVTGCLLLDVKQGIVAQPAALVVTGEERLSVLIGSDAPQKHAWITRADLSNPSVGTLALFSAEESSHADVGRVEHPPADFRRLAIVEFVPDVPALASQGISSFSIRVQSEGDLQMSIAIPVVVQLPTPIHVIPARLAFRRPQTTSTIERTVVIKKQQPWMSEPRILSTPDGFAVRVEKGVDDSERRIVIEIAPGVATGSWALDLDVDGQAVSLPVHMREN